VRTFGSGSPHACPSRLAAFNVTRERIRQIENQSLKKLQQLGEAQKLREVT